MKHLTLIFYILSFIAFFLKYGLIIDVDISNELPIDYIIMGISFLFTIYWSNILWKSSHISKASKVGYIIGMLLFSVVFVPMVAYQLDGKKEKKDL